MDRRSLLKSAAALSAATVTAPIAAAAAPEVVATTTVPVAPAKLTPYANYVWEWFVSNDGETYYEPFPTKEEALEYARLSEYSIVAECKLQDFDLGVDGYRLIEDINENNYEKIGEGEGIECTPAQERDLEAMVQRAIEAWVVKHSIKITAWSFGEVRNETNVPAST